MSKNTVPDLCYSEQDYILSTPTWEEFRKTPKSSWFDLLLGDRWQQAMDNDVFNYKLHEDDLKKRVVPGNEKYLTVLNTCRGQKRRLPEVIDSLNKPFDPQKFHFNKVKREEILMNFCPAEYISENNTQNGTSEIPSNEHQIIINSSPFTFGHCLLVPDVERCLPQRVTLRGMKLALEMMLLSSHPGFRIGFNGLCALASVNHQHVHGWYLDHELRIEHAPVEHVGGPCYRMVNMPSEGLAFQLHGYTATTLSRAVFAVTDYLHKSDIAHNMFLTRGVVFGEDPGSSHTTVRVYVWPRKHYIGEKAIPGTAVSRLFHVAVAELGGHVPIYFSHRFDDISEEEIVSSVKEVMLPEEKFTQLCEAVKSLMEDIQAEKT